jgi:hypothetical protein
MNIFGYFDAPEQTIPAFDPGLEVQCPFCLIGLEEPMVCTSLMRVDRFGGRSYFYRAHKPCKEFATEDDIVLVEAMVIDAPDRELDSKILSTTEFE